LAAKDCYGSAMPHQANTEETTEDRHLSERPYPLQMALTLRSKTIQPRTKKADMAEHPEVLDHVGLLTNEPPGTAGLPFI
jgi:hypothetical protein